MARSMFGAELPAAIINMTVSLAAELSSSGVTVNTVSLGL
ncbi:Hypothetical protein A7982_03976 [Minicystis rosea]|nr:Hypothetical protein A7982_03976 [Minicystis rosea]